jgi:type II secretory pathway predicted ATPase ExeA
MNPLHNPFSPGAGSPPPELVGRDAILEKAKISLARVKNRRPEKSFLLVGLRGVGKTVLLRQIEKLAKELDYKTIFIESTENKSLNTSLILSIREILYALDLKERLSMEVKRAFRILRSFANGIKLKHGDMELSLLDVDPELGVADSGNLEHDLPSLFEAIAEAAAARQTAIALIIDELQYLSEQELSALIMAVHRISQKNLPLILVGAGLPQLPRLAGDSKSYSERLFDFPEIGALSEIDSMSALQEPAKERGANFTQEAIQKIIKQTKGYPYFIQEWGYQSWNISDSPTIDTSSVEKASLESIKRLDDNFFRVRFDRLTPNEKKYLRALAELSEENRKSGNVAEKLRIAANNASPTRSSLIKKGMIYSKRYGDTEFTVPLFDQFMKRIMPNLED